MIEVLSDLLKYVNGTKEISSKRLSSSDAHWGIETINFKDTLGIRMQTWKCEGFESSIPGPRPYCPIYDALAIAPGQVVWRKEQGESVLTLGESLGSRPL